MYDLEGSNNVDPLVSGFGSIYWTVKYICPVNLLSVLIFSKQTRACRGYPSSKHVCSTACLTARPHALRPCARQPRGCHLKWNEHLYRSARRRPQLNPRGPAACGHLRFECARQLCIRGCTSVPWLPAPVHARAHFRLDT